MYYNETFHVLSSSAWFNELQAIVENNYVTLVIDPIKSYRLYRLSSLIQTNFDNVAVG